MSTTRVYWPYLSEGGLNTAADDLENMLQDDDLPERAIWLAQRAQEAIAELFAISEYEPGQGRYFPAEED